MIIVLLILLAFNIWNFKHDAKLINDQKQIDHRANAIFYTLLTLSCTVGMFFKVDWYSLFVIPIAFLFRPLVFDPGLNLSRSPKLSFFYVSLAALYNDPKASFIDKLEVKVFGNNGKKTYFFYLISFIIFIGFYYFVTNG